MNSYRVVAILTVQASDYGDAEATVRAVCDRGPLDDGTDVENVVTWSESPHGWCYECGAPARFVIASLAQVPESPRVRLASLRCAICAGNNAADGEQIYRLDKED